MTDKTILSLKEFKELYNTFYFSLCLFADRYMNDIELSKDLVQDVFVKIWNNKTPFESELAIKTYLYRSVRNKCFDVLKSKDFKSKSKLTDYDLSVIESESFYEKEIFIEEVSRIIDTAVNTLPKKCAVIIKLSLKGLCNTQISEELSVSISTVKAQKRIAYQKLRPLLKQSVLSLCFCVFNRFFY